MDIIIRNALETDYPAIIATLKEFAVFQKTAPEKVINTAELMKEEKDFFHCFIAEGKAGELAGMATCSYAYYSWTGKALYLDDLYVKPAFRKLGIGKQLLDAVIAFAKN
jgi:diamine N-acetyltransferase